MSFEQLLADLDAMHTDLQKSDTNADMGADGGDAGEGNDDDAGIAAAAADGAGEGDGDGDEGAGAGQGDGDGDEGMVKSFSFTLEDGTVVDAMDGAELVKSLINRMESTEGVMQKAMGSMIDLIKSQGAELKAVRGELSRLAAAGRGRKTVVSVAERPEPGNLQKSEPAGVSGAEFMSKALAAQTAGKISALDVSRAEAYLLKGLPVPPAIVGKVLS